jgi:hemin uptake protein HemP
MDKMRELVQQSASSSTELSAAAEQMLKLSRNLLDNMDRFVIDHNGQLHSRRDAPASRRDAAASRRPAQAPESNQFEYAEVTRS